MSYCELIVFKDGKISGGIEFHNAWGGAARIWDALFEKYLRNPAIPFHSWICGDQQPLWNLCTQEDLPRHERAVHLSTMDLAYIRKDNFSKFCEDLRKFVEAYPVGQRVDHLTAWAQKIETLEADAIGFHGTSVASNPWIKYDDQKDESREIPLSDGFEVYDEIEKPLTATH